MDLIQDPVMKKFIQGEQQKQKFQDTVKQLTEECFDFCVTSPGSKLGSSAEHCIVNCVERFIDTTNFVANRIQRSAQSSSSSSGFV
ncbi:mitochondrial import inner membrane translocase subunit Tim8 A-like [Ostrea edulis]|uniref:mitochondrial import inner membrane translocase subunit Tim8 A-like n=1 Tax=Ostrea edulis TaxID=37623 RepID=UPI002095CD27|nr:mitochondrial import inner membrane translocase subunit Tim8 A-like [Ostrea edulis]